MVDEKIDVKEAEELKKNDNQFIENRKEFMKKINFEVEDVFGDFISKDSFSPEQTTEINNLLPKIM